MYEEELLEKIRKSSEEVKIPEELKPDEIEKKLKSTKMRPKKWMGTMGAAAAAILLLCSAGAVYRVSVIGSKNMEGTSCDTAPEESAESGGGLGDAMESGDSEKSATVAKAEPKRDAGDLYKVAEDYTQVYQALQPPVYSEEEVKERGFLEKIADNFLGSKGSKSGWTAAGFQR